LLNVTSPQPIDSWKYSLNPLNHGANVTFSQNSSQGLANLTNLMEITHSLWVYATNSNGTSSAFASFTINPTLPENISLNILSSTIPSDGARYIANTDSNYTITLNALANLDVSVWRYSLNNGTDVIFTPRVTNISLPVGDHKIIFKVETSDNKRASREVNFKVVFEPPIVTIKSPTSGSTYEITSGNTYSLLLNATADQPITTWRYSYGNQPNQTFSPGVSSLSLPRGSYVLRVYGVNSNGVGSASASFTIIDSSAPVTATQCSNVGMVCQPNQICIGGTMQVIGGQICCVGGICGVDDTDNDSKREISIFVYLILSLLAVLVLLLIIFLIVYLVSRDKKINKGEKKAPSKGMKESLAHIEKPSSKNLDKTKEFIETARKKGYKDEQIKCMFKKKGWNDKDIQRAFDLFKK
jgi:hypothetical protein